MGRRGALAVVAAVVAGAVLVVGVLLATSGDDEQGQASPTPTTLPEPVPTDTGDESVGYDVYVAVGDSLVAGYQPTNPGDRSDPDGGYVGRVRDRLAEVAGAPVELVNVGCSGETVGTLLDGGRCEYPEGAQLDAAESVLAGQPDDGAGTLVTVQIGANDVQRCVVLDAESPTVDEECVATGLEAVRTGLPEVLDRLRAAAPAARLVVVDYYNPFVVAALLGPRAQDLAVRSQEVQTELNDELAVAAAAVDAGVAPVGETFAASVPDEATAGPSVGPICSWTWMCASTPDIHATDAGYAVIADQVLATLGVR